MGKDWTCLPLPLLDLQLDLEAMWRKHFSCSTEQETGTLLTHRSKLSGCHLKLSNMCLGQERFGMRNVTLESPASFFGSRAASATSKET